MTTAREIIANFIHDPNRGGDVYTQADQLVAKLAAAGLVVIEESEVDPMQDTTLTPIGARISWAVDGSDHLQQGPLVKVCRNGMLVVGTETAEGHVDGHIVISPDQVRR